MAGEENEKGARKNGAVFYAGLCAFVGGVLLLIAFSSPYWLQSYEIAYLEFKNMGLWQFCFRNFRYPKNQFDHKFNGCHYVFSEEYRIIREWMLPGWFQTVQTFISLAFLTSYFCQLVLALILMKLPMFLWRRFELEMTFVALLSALGTVVGLFLGVAIFGAKCWDRGWLLYPNYNYLSWSYYLAIFSLGLHTLTTLLLGLEVVAIRQRRAADKNILMHMQPAESHHGSAYI